MVRFGESSMNSGASASSEDRSAILRQSSSLIRPERRSFSFTRASAENSRIMMSCLLISREKITVGACCRIAAERAKSIASVDLPEPGRPATTTICPGCSPCNISSNCSNPVGTPPLPSLTWIRSSSSIVVCSRSSIRM